MARCRYCQEKTGWFKRSCGDCQEMLEALRQLPQGFSFRQLLDCLMATRASNEKIRLFLDTDWEGQGSLRDTMTAHMTNQLAKTMGQATDMVPQKVKMIREAETKNPTPNDLPGEINPYRR